MSGRGVLSALSHRSFALVWVGALVSNVGNWMEVVSQSWLVWDRSHSTEWSGLLPFAATIPATLLSIPMGLVADRVDRRRLLLACHVAAALVAALQAYVAHVGWTEPPVIVAIAFLGGIAMGAAGPAWHALVPELVPREDLSGAIALNSAQFNFARVAGPPLAALVIREWDVAVAFDVNVASFALVVLALAIVPHRDSRRTDGRKDWRRDLGEAIAFARAHGGVRRLLPTGALFLFFAAPIFALLPATATQLLQGDVDDYTWLISAIGLGAILGAFLIGHVGRLMTRQRAIAISAYVVGGALLGIATSRDARLSQGLLFAFGIGWCVLLTMQGTVLQLLAPDAMRGRIMSLNHLAVVTAAPAGQLVAGFVAERVLLPATLAIMAIGCGLVGLWQLIAVVPAMEDGSARPVR